MKKTLLICTLACLLATPVVLADTVSITSNASFASPSGQSLTSTTSIGFVGPQTITFTVAGKTCNLNGSAKGSVPMGCNYSLTVAPNGSISGTLTAGNAVCTQSSQIASSCK
jgi:opacity protein-like surface antigen